MRTESRVPYRSPWIVIAAGAAVATACGDGPAGPGGGPLTITTESVPPANVAQPYSTGIDAVRARCPSAAQRPDHTDGSIAGVATSPGEYAFTVRLSRGAERTFRAFTLAVVPDDPRRLRLTRFDVVPIPPAIEPHVEAAIDRWEEVLTGDVTNGTIPRTLFSGSSCGGFGQDANGAAVDDVLVLVDIDDIDGPGQVLAQAGPCGIRGDDLPFAGILTLDTADLHPITGTETLTAVIAHEIGHVLGFGALWLQAMLLTGAAAADPRFTGAAAVAQWHGLGGTGDVPVEDQGGEGTVDSHLRESVFGNELMTGFSEPVGVAQPLSRVTVAAMGDLGYAVSLAAWCPWTRRSRRTCGGP